MKKAMTQKRVIGRLVWSGSCLLAAAAMAFVVLGKTVGCAESDLTGFPLAIPTQTEEQKPVKKVCLTFDDGPSATTMKVLEVLRDKQVPATFFVIAAPNNEKYLYLIQQEVQEGHQIALHSASHEYNQIYTSPAAYWSDIKQLREKISPYVDVENIHWLRFPGGSANTVSHKYGGNGIMKSLKRQAKEKGYCYVDWNVCAGDAVGGHPSADKILQNVIKDVKDQETCVVLMHDTKATKNTAEALPNIIDWFREEGYVFCRVDEMDKTNDEPDNSED